MSGGLAVRVALALRFLPGAPDEVARADLVARALETLERLEALEDRTRGLEDDPALGRELGRLERKVDTVIEMLGELLALARARPPAVDAVLRADAIAWNAGGAPPAPGTRGCIEFYPGALPWPLTVPARVVGLDADGLVEAHFDELPEALAEALARLVFRRHRRSIASTRRPPLS